jgi:peptidyl-prolyl cis-trans isomerase C
MRRALLLTLGSSLACSLFVAAALAQDDGADPTAPTPAPAQRQYSAEDQARRARVIARVGEATITVGDVEDAINQQSPFLRVRYRDPAQLRTFVDGMIRFELLARAAERAGVGNDPEVRRVGKQNAVQQLIRRDFDERITPDSIPEQDVRAYYDAHPEEFSREELRRAAHIQVATREEADRLLAQARSADARAFRELTRDHSLDPETRLRGGDLRYFDREGGSRNGQDPPVDRALAAAAFGLNEVGDVAEPVQVGERWSIVKLTGRRPPEHRTIEQAAPTIRLRLWRQRRQDSLEELVTRLRTEANVQVHYDRLRPIRLDPAPREDGDGHDHGEVPEARPAAEAPAQEAAPTEPAQGAAPTAPASAQ